ncbi:MAG: AI-2E family transporter [Caldilineaceae bacterium]
MGIRSYLQNTDKAKAATAAIDSTIFSAWTFRQIVMATVTAVGVGLAFLLLYRFYMVVFIFFAALSLQVAIKPLVDSLYKWGIHYSYGILLVYTILFAGMVLLLWLMAPLLVTQTVTVVTELPEYYAALRTYLLTSRSTLLHLLAEQLPVQLSLSAATASAATASAGEEAVDPISPVLGVLGSFGRIFFVLTAILALAFSWTLEGERVIRRLLLRVPQEQRAEVRTLIAEMEGKIGDYFRGQAILCVIVGVMSVLAFLVLGIPNALVLGGMMGIFEAIPVIGPTLGAIPAVLLTLAVAPGKTIWVIVALVGIQVLENNLLVPRIMDESVGVNAIVSILAIAAFGLLFGLGGAILAIPLAAILQILINRFLFALPAPEEGNSTGIAPSPVMTPPHSRGHIGKLRLQAQELAQDIRKQARSEELLTNHQSGEINEEAEQIEDLIEAIAVELDTLLTETQESTEQRHP